MYQIETMRIGVDRRFVRAVTGIPPWHAGFGGSRIAPQGISLAAIPVGLPRPHCVRACAGRANGNLPSRFPEVVAADRLMQDRRHGQVRKQGRKRQWPLVPGR